VAVQLVVRSARRGRLSGGDHVFNLGNNATGYAKPSSIVPVSIIRQVNHYKRLIASGKIVPPTITSVDLHKESRHTTNGRSARPPPFHCTGL
jgi:basic membrane lipoprotein Med (substrate-binding protein (PBP1-ABC) superfamily)